MSRATAANTAFSGKVSKDRPSGAYYSSQKSFGLIVVFLHLFSKCVHILYVCWKVSITELRHTKTLQRDVKHSVFSLKVYSFEK